MFGRFIAILLGRRTVKTISPELRDMLREWDEWANRDQPPQSVRLYGLCDYTTVSNVGFNHRHELRKELRSIFSHEGFHQAFPFGRDDFLSRGFNGTMHLCPKRVAWVEAHKNLPTKEV